jgi:hypothetical protein
MQSRDCLHICDILDIAHPQVVTLRADNSVHLVTVESMKAVIAIVLHALGPVDSKDQVMVIDETSSEFWCGPPMQNFIPLMVVLPAGYGLQSRKGTHWL